MTGVDPAWIAGTDFIMVHRSLVAALDGNYEAAMVLDRVRFRSSGPGSANGWWEATRAELQEETGLSKWKLDQAVKLLKEAGFLESERITSYDPTQRWRVILENQEQVNQATGLTVSQDSRTTLFSKNDKNPPTPHGGAEFEEFWSLYPRKEGKGAARKAWDRLPPAQTRTVLDGLRAQLPDLTRKERKYQPMPATWLSQTRWEDEVVYNHTARSTTNMSDGGFL